MNRIAATSSWIVALASFAMMLAVQTLHSPLQHVLECGADGCHTHSATSDESEETCSGKKPAHSHVHFHHGHLHVHVHTHEAEGATDTGKSSDETPKPGDGHSHSPCHLCQFLTQALHPVMPPVLLTGEEAICAPPVDILPEIVLVPLVGPYVRGPPQCV